MLNYLLVSCCKYIVLTASVRRLHLRFCHSILIIVCLFSQYVYFRMGVKQAEMVKSRLFRFTLDEVRHRHSFLERRGLYQTPDKKGQTIIINPKLDSILNIDQDTFLTHVAMASAEEYDVFKRLMAREWQEQEQQQGGIKANSDAEEEDEEDEETGGKSGYTKRRKK